MREHEPHDRRAARPARDVAAPARPGPVAPLHHLQQLAGNRAVVQRLFAPAKLTKTAHLHTADKKGKARWSAFGRTGDKLAPGHELMVDEDQRSSGFVRAVNVKADAWESRHSTEGPYFLRTGSFKSDLGKLHGDNKGFHPTHGVFEKKGDSLSESGAWIVVLGNTTLGLYKPATRELIAGNDKVPFKDGAAVGHWNLYGQSPVDQREVVRPKIGGPSDNYKKRDSDDLPLEKVTLTPTERLLILQASQTKAFEDRKAMDPALGKNQTDVTTTTVAYTPKVGTAATVKILGNSKATLYTKQLGAVTAALKTLENGSVPLVATLEIVISSMSSKTTQGFKQEAFHTGASSAAIVLTGMMFEDPEHQHDQKASGIRGGTPKESILGVAHQLATGKPKDTGREGVIGEGVVIHEIGHAMHKVANPDAFAKIMYGEKKDADDMTEGEKQDQRDLGLASKQVSHYASSNEGPLELVAEVYTGVIKGLKYPKSVIDQYLKYGGPKVWAKNEDVIDESTKV